MSIGALFGEPHNCMHDLESFFWVLFWICIHYDGPNKPSSSGKFDKWNYADTDDLAEGEKGIVVNDGDFGHTTWQFFTPYFEPLRPFVDKLRKVVFPGGNRRKQEDDEDEVYFRMKDLLRKAMKDAKVRAE